MTAPPGDPVTITHDPAWRRPLWDPDIPARPAWFVSCTAHPHLGHDQDGQPWGYAEQGRARSVATRHRRAHHARGCDAESLDGHEHEGPLTEYVGVCVRGHERRGFVCAACAGAGPNSLRGPRAVACAECPDDDRRPRVLVPVELWEKPRTGAAL